MQQLEKQELKFRSFEKASRPSLIDYLDHLASKNGYALVQERRAIISHWLNEPSGIPIEGKDSTREEWIAAILPLVGLNNSNKGLLPFYLSDWSGVQFPPPSNPRFKFCDLFAGIGGFRLALQEAGGQCVFSSEINNSARQTYFSNFGEWPFGDIREFSSKTDEEIHQLIPDHDVLCAGFPCQPFSHAGVSARNFYNLQHGLECEDQGNLFFDMAKIIEVKKPAVLFLENVRNFRSHDGGQTLKTVKSFIERMGYKFSSQLISANRHVPQNRMRFYMVCFLDGRKFDFPEFHGDMKALKTILEKEVPDSYTISDLLWTSHEARSRRNRNRGTGFTITLADINKPSNTLVARYGKDGKECLIPQEGKNPRMLTPRECARLMGFPENYILPITKTPAYKQFGNSVVVPLIRDIMESILEQMQQPVPASNEPMSLFDSEELSRL